MTWYGLFAPKGTPAVAVGTLNKRFNEALSREDVRATLVGQGVQAEPATPEALGKRVASDLEKWRRVIADNKIKVE